MATNRALALARRFALDVATVKGTGPANAVKSGDPVAVGQIAGVALTDRGTDNKATIDTRGAFSIPVKGVNDVPANVAVAVGDVVYFDNTFTPGQVDVGPNGVRFGYALDPVAAGATTTIRVKIGY